MRDGYTKAQLCMHNSVNDSLVQKIAETVTLKVGTILYFIQTFSYAEIYFFEFYRYVVMIFNCYSCIIFVN